MRRAWFPLAALAVLTASPAAHAEEAPPPRLIVSGEGTAAAAPDLAVLSFSVLREAATASDALGADNEAMTAVIADLKTSGVASRDLQTAGIAISPRYSNPSPDKPDASPAIVGYQAVNTLTVRVRKLDRVGAIFDRAVKLGVNQGGGIGFVVEDPSKVLDEARKHAMTDALDRAKTLAAAGGVKLGRILEISEQSAPQQPQPMMAKAMRYDAAVPVEGGENTYQVTVSVTFAID